MENLLLRQPFRGSDLAVQELAKSLVPTRTEAQACATSLWNGEMNEAMNPQHFSWWEETLAGLLAI